MIDTSCRRPASTGLRCAFTGYRPHKMPFGSDECDSRCIDFKRRLVGTIETLIDQGYTHYLSGGAQAMDTYASEAVLKLREMYPELTLEMVVPFDGQADNWPENERERHARLLQSADIVTVISHEYTKSCMFMRNRYLVNNADLLFAAYDGQPGGTAMTCQYARDKGVQVIYIPPVVRRLSGSGNVCDAVDRKYEYTT